MNTRTVLRRRHAAAPVTVRSAGWLSAGILLATAALGPAAHTVAAASVIPTPVNTGNPRCSDFAPAGETWQQFKLDGDRLKDGIYTDGTITVTITNFADSASGSPGSFDWAADQGVDAVFVKAGSSKHNLYVYSPEATSDEGVGPQAGRGNGIGHVLFCYDGVDVAQPVTSADPTDPPSADPSDAPSAEPSDDPTVEPSDPPSADPSDAPSAEPSDDPTVEPSDAPSADPTVEPSDAPSADPSDNPSSDPSQGADPSNDPGSQPTDDPGATQTNPPVDGGIGDQAAATADPTASPTGAVLGATSGPVVTAPPTDTLGIAPAHSSAVESWRIIAAGLGCLIVGFLLAPARPARSRTRR